MEDVRSSHQPFALQPSAGSAWTRAALGVAAPVLERALGLTSLSRMYGEATGPSLVDDFPERALAHLEIGWTVDDAALARIPATGPLVVVANHPFGAVDGLVLLALIRRVRPDVRLLGNYLLQRIPELAPLIIAVDPFGGGTARAENGRTLRRAIDWTRRGGALIVFPAGEVSSVPTPGGRLIDTGWKPGVGRILQASRAAVLPVYFAGRNSRVFELAGRLHRDLRTALLPRELLRMRGRTIAPAVGSLIPPARLDESSKGRQLLDYLRARTYALRPSEPALARPKTPMPAVAEPVHSGFDFEREITALPVSRRLLSNKAFDVFYASATEIPATLGEIGRLRELAFRAAGEGSGQPLDLDEFDRHYWHLFVWDREARSVVGAYRIGATDAIVPRLGVRGLYTRTLFTYSQAFIRALGPALELGRSFVRVEYQREFSPLLLLWQGIGQFVAQNPRYTKLFGPVSISASYSGPSRDALVELLSSDRFRSPMADLVRARRPYFPESHPARPVVPVDPSEVQALIGDIEVDGKGMPVLLRQYLKLNARVAAISVDPDFANVIDALSIVDLDTMPVALRHRYTFRPGS